MKIEKTDILIIGAGLTGLTLAYKLKSENKKVHIIEARDRLGGRIQTAYKNKAASIELGATWLGRKHTTLIDLLRELKLDIFRQELSSTAIYEPISTSPHQLVNLPPNEDPSYRIKGGSSSLINALMKELEGAAIKLNEIVESIVLEEAKVLVTTNKQQYVADKVVSTMPPNLLVNKVQLNPELPKGIEDLARSTHTWMGESIKVALRFKEPFWRQKGLSGTIFSNVGPVAEMYVHSDATNSYFALKGFLNGIYFTLAKDERLKLVMEQLEKYYGSKVKTYLDYEEKVWRNEAFTYFDYDDHVLPHQNNGHSAYEQTYFDGKLIIGGAETSAIFPGYMEGAVCSARSIKHRLLASKSINTQL